MKPDASLSSSQGIATSLYSVPDKSNPGLPSHLQRFVSSLFFVLCLCIPSVSFLQNFLRVLSMHFCSLICLPHASTMASLHRILLFFVKQEQIDNIQVQGNNTNNMCYTECGGLEHNILLDSLAVKSVLQKWTKFSTKKSSGISRIMQILCLDASYAR